MRWAKSLVSDSSVHVVYMNMSFTLNFFIIPLEAPSREVYNLVARVYHTGIARPA